MSINILENFAKTKLASKEVVENVDEILLKIANKIYTFRDKILEENKKDLLQANTNDPSYPRLKLDINKINQIIGGIKKVAQLKSSIGQILEEKNLENGLHIQKVSVPLGVVAAIYEARPNVTPDIFSLAFKSGNAVILKGGKDAYNSHLVFVEIIQSVLKENNLNPNWIYLMPPDRKFITDLFEAVEFVDVVIPRGSQSLINFTRKNCKVPVIETGAGVCHIFWSSKGDIKIAKEVILNSKVSRPFACNALDTLLVAEENLSKILEVIKPLEKNKVKIYADKQAFLSLKDKYKFIEDQEVLGKEFLGWEMSIKIVKNLENSLKIIDKFSSKHSECIITEDANEAKVFQNMVDASSVYANTSLAFTDGGEFGLGCEVGISTQKLHARGPMGLESLTSYKWLINSGGAIRT